MAVFDAGLRSELDRRLDDEIEIRAGLERGEFGARFQPIVQPRFGRIVAVEALARWERPGAGQQPASAFLSLVEDLGLVHEVNEIVRAEAFAMRAALTGLVDDDFDMHVNVSPDELAPTSMGRLLAAIEAAGCPTDGVVLEITESAVAADLDTAVAVLSDVRDRGLAVHLDDFGTGYSSLSLIARLPLDGLKLDRALLLGAAGPGAGRAVFAASIDLARRLGLHVVAEGVEEVEQADLVTALGCDQAQGWLWAPAVDGATLVEWFRSGPPWRQGGVPGHDGQPLSPGRLG